MEEMEGNAQVEVIAGRNAVSLMLGTSLAITMTLNLNVTNTFQLF